MNRNGSNRFFKVKLDIIFGMGKATASIWLAAVSHAENF